MQCRHVKKKFPSKDARNTKGFCISTEDFIDILQDQNSCNAGALFERHCEMMSTQHVSPLDGQSDKIMLSRTLPACRPSFVTDVSYGTAVKAPPFSKVFVVWMLAHATRHAGRGGRPSAHRPKRPSWCRPYIQTEAGQPARGQLIVRP